MSSISLIIAAIFLPLFPISMVFNWLFARIRHPLLRAVILIAWPLVGLAVIAVFNISIPTWLLTWAVLTSVLYALRALALREVGQWTGFVATSSWALLWILLMSGIGQAQIHILAIGMSVPFALMALLTGELEKRFGAAYHGVCSGLAQSIPKLSGVLVVVVLAVVATPLFPGFFAMLFVIIKSTSVAPYVAMGVGLVWLLWSWAGAKLLQGLIVGQKQTAVIDLSNLNMWMYIVVLAALVFEGVYWLGVMA